MVTLNGIGDQLTATEFEIDGTRFFIAKLPAMGAFALLEMIRHELGRAPALSMPEATSGADTMSLLKIVLSLDPAFVRRVRSTLFEKVSFSNARAVDPQPLAGSEDMAFDGLEPVAVYETLLRCLAVNFTESLRAIASRFPDVDLSSSLSDLSA